MTPIKSNILVKPFLSDEISTGGIYIPDSVRQCSDKVLVVKVGNGTKEKPMNLKEGQIGFRVSGWGLQIIIDNEKHYLMESDAIIAINE